MEKVKMHLGALYTRLIEVVLQINSDSIQDIQAKVIHLKNYFNDKKI